MSIEELLAYHRSRNWDEEAKQASSSLIRRYYYSDKLWTDPDAAEDEDYSIRQTYYRTQGGTDFRWLLDDNFSVTVCGAAQWYKEIINVMETIPHDTLAKFLHTTFVTGPSILTISSRCGYVYEHAMQQVKDTGILHFLKMQQMSNPYRECFDKMYEIIYTNRSNDG